MAEAEYAPDRSLRVVLWIARVMSAIVVVFLVVMVVGYTINPQGSGREPTPREWYGLALFPFGLCIGYVIGWRWRLLGGIISLICLAAFLIFLRDRDMIPVISIVGVPAVLYIIYGISRRRLIPADAPGGDPKVES
ncbi:MAG: hypothetical protein JXB45_04050 [Candidatus Krumholzibacteriota bacterium]|nr:hypothetical protein [Candidatus Krumholzibacteriota bacterium]